MQSHEAKLMSIPIAMMMAVVAMLGAVVAYRAALAEQSTLRSERRLQQGKVLELARRQETLSKMSSRARYEYSREVYTAEADNDLKEARLQAATDRSRAAWLRLQAQEDHAVQRALQPYLNFFEVQLPRPLEESLQYNAAAQLREYGFDTRWTAPTKKGDAPESIWKDAELGVDRERHQTLVLAGTVVLFVVALASLTFAQLFHFWRWPGSIVGMFLALVGIIVAMRADSESWQTLVPFCAAFLLMGFVGHKFSRSLQFVPPEESEPIHPGEVDPAIFPGMKLHTAPVAHGFGRFTVAMIAVTAVLSAGSGFLLSRATSKSASAFSESIDQQGAVFKAESREEASSFYTMGELATLQEYLVRFEAAGQRANLAGANPSLLDLKQANVEREHWRQSLLALLKSSEGLLTMFSSPYGPEQDRNFPSKLVNETLAQSEAAFALSDASNEASLRWQKKATIYLAILTFFAIALYLFGQGLSMGRTHAAFILVFFSCCLVAYTFGYGLFMSWENRSPQLHSSRPECREGEKAEEDPDQDAAHHYASGRRLYQGYADDRGELMKAAKEFSCAVDVRPTFAMANFYYALSVELSGTPQLNENGFVSLTSKKMLPMIVDHERQAVAMIRQQGYQPPGSLQISYSFNSLMQGLVEENRKTVERALEDTRDASKLDQTALVASFNLGLGLLADGQKKEGLTTYRQIIKGGLKDQGDLVAGAITDLETLHRYCVGVNRSKSDCREINEQIIPKLKAEMVAAAWPAEGSGAPATHSKIGDIDLTVTESRFGWHALDANIDSGDVLSILWYAYNPEWETWRVLPAVSGQVSWNLDHKGNVSDVLSALRASGGRNCITDGKYRAELYLNGKLAATKEKTTDVGNFLPMAFPALNIALCYPASWGPWDSSDLPPGSLVKGYKSEDGTRGVYLFTYFNPGNDPDDTSKNRHLAEAVSFLVDHKLVPRPTVAQAISKCGEQGPQFGEKLGAFSDGVGAGVAKAWMESDGLTHVAVVFDNREAQPNCETLMSATTLN